MSFAPVYLDWNATTPLDAAVREAMLPWLGAAEPARFGNASSRHEYGRAARRAIDEARQQVADAVGAVHGEIVFTSGGSEANNLLLKGYAERSRPGRLAVGACEHPCVLKPAEQLARRGWQVEQLPVDPEGLILFPVYAEILARRPALVSVMLANNETGVVQDIAALARVAREAGAYFHSDAVQAFGKLALDFRVLNGAGVNALSLSAHKIGGPQGAGALVLDKRLDLDPLIAGGGHERGLRSGTENVAAIVGFGEASRLVRETQAERARALTVLRDRLVAALSSLGARVFGLRAERLPNTVYFSLPGIDGETLVAQLDRAGFAVASGAACSSANPEPSHVLQAMGVDPLLARGAVRVSLGATTQGAEIDEFMTVLQATYQRLQQLTALAV